MPALQYTLWARDPAYPEHGQRPVTRGSLAYVKRELRDRQESIANSGGQMPYPPREFEIRRSS